MASTYRLPVLAVPARKHNNSNGYAEDVGSMGKDPSPHPAAAAAAAPPVAVAPPVSSQSTLEPEGQIHISSQTSGVAFMFASPAPSVPTAKSGHMVVDTHVNGVPVPLPRRGGGGRGGGGGGGGGGSGEAGIGLIGPQAPFRNEPGEGHSDQPPANTRCLPFTLSTLEPDRAPPPSTTMQKRSACISRPMVKNPVDSTGINPHAVTPLERVVPKPRVEPEFHPPKEPHLTRVSFPRPPHTPPATARSMAASNAPTPRTHQGVGKNSIGTWLRQEGQQPHRIPAGNRAGHAQSSVIGVVAELMVSTPDGRSMSPHKKPGALFGQMYMVGEGSFQHGKKGQPDDVLDAMHRVLRDRPDKQIVM